MVEEESREQIEEIINNEEPVKEAVIETITEEEKVKPKAKSKAKSKAKPKIKITKEPVEVVVEEPVVEEQPKKISKLRQIVKCPDCNMDMTAHTLKYIHKRRGFCKAAKEVPEQTPEPVPPKPKIITEDTVND